MPYSSVKQIPAWVRRKRGPKGQRQWMHVFNSVFDKTGNEKRSFKAAASAIKSALRKKE